MSLHLHFRWVQKIEGLSETEEEGLHASLPYSPFFSPNFILGSPFLGCPNGPIGYSLCEPSAWNRVWIEWFSVAQRTERSLDLHSEGSDPKSLCWINCSFLQNKGQYAVLLRPQGPTHLYWRGLCKCCLCYFTIVMSKVTNRNRRLKKSKGPGMVWLIEGDSNFK